ncbi:galactosylceramide sulfotransferase-like [Clavelina lepadiformis]|uniref:galactosylceramide sulfotransferase-like n=1 Tax=Clavelina lepadiformis TaxID=159417 RepID=UPI0040418E47
MDKNTKYISIVREPWYQFQSSFHFYYTCPRSKKTFLSTGCYVYPYIEIAKGKELSLFEYFNLAYENLNSSIPWFFRSKNYQAFDLGLDPMLDDDEEIEIQVQRLSSQIDLMMITEYMDESLILLKDLLCMDWDDVTSYKGENKTPYTSITLEEYPEVMKKFNKMFKLDVALYRRFNATFWQKVEDYGRERMYNDVMTLRRLREKRKEDNDVKDEELSRSRRNSVADSHYKLYATVPKAPTRNYELNILKRKIAEQSRGLNPSQIIDLADYMADNYGLCPL